MAIIKWTPFDRMLDDFFSDGFAPMLRSQAFAPAMDIFEDKDNVVVETALPGVEPDQVSIEIEDNVLKVSGQVEHKSEVDEQNYYRKEVRSGSFFRSVALPKAVNGDKASASFNHGLLRITIPKAEEAKPKKIAIQAEKG